ncbi:MAG: response regulator [Cyanobacteria bacterium P01_D01_bin.128]
MSVATERSFVLIVDDNPTNLAVLSETLGKAGIRFRVAMDGESALAQIERNHPALILLDVQMPGIDGFETCRRLKENTETQAIPVIFTTALADADSKAQGFSAGAVDYIPKPFDQVEVLARVRVHLHLRQLTESLEQQVQERTETLKQAQVQLVQQEKLSSLGELVAGIAHEINNPVNFIVNSIKPLQEYVSDITEILHRYQEEYPEPSSQLQEAIKELELDFLLEDIDKIVNSFSLGAERIREISASLRTFSRSDSETQVPANFHVGLDSTLLLLKHRLNGKGNRRTIEIFKSYGEIPEVLCYAGQINQVFMNLLANAIDALEEAMLSGKMVDSTPQIHISTYLSDQRAVVQIEDNGVGIPESVQQRLFEPLFTTKPIGKGTGLGLAIAYQIVVDKHHGHLKVRSQAGKGATFQIEIPISFKASTISS